MKFYKPLNVMLFRKMLENFRGTSKKLRELYKKIYDQITEGLNKLIKVLVDVRKIF